MAISLSGMTLHTDNDNEGGWSGTDGNDTYFKAVQGTNSQSWNVAKNGVETGVLTKAATMPTTRGVFTFWMASDLSFYYTDIRLELESSTNNLKQFIVADSVDKAIGGDFVCTAVDYVNKGSATGTFNPASLATTRIIVDNSSSGNIRAVINNWIDAMYFGPGHTISGTTTGDKLFTEATAQDELTANRYGVLRNFNGIIFCQADLSLVGTALVSDAEVLVFANAANGYDIYNLDITGTVTFINTSILTAGAKLFNFDSSNATSFSMEGGALEGCNTLDFGATQAVKSVVISNGVAVNIANTPTNCTFVNNTAINLTGTLTNPNITAGTASSAAIVTTDIDKITGGSITRNGSGYGVELTALADGTWNTDTTGYRTGTTGSPITPYYVGSTATGDEALFINLSSGTINIAVSGVSPPSVALPNGSTAVVNVTGFKPTLTLTGVIAGSDISITLHGTTTEIVDDVISGTSYGYQYTYTASTYVDIRIIKAGYKVWTQYNYLLSSVDTPLPVSQVIDRAYG